MGPPHVQRRVTTDPHPKRDEPALWGQQLDEMRQMGLDVAWAASCLVHLVAQDEPSEGCIRLALELGVAHAPGPEVWQAVSSLETVTAPALKGRLWPGMEHLVGCEVLRLSGRLEQPVRPLGTLTRLRRLELKMARLDLAMLAPLSGRLRELSLVNCGVTDARGLKFFDRLEVLNLSRTAVTDLSPLAGLPLKVLRVARTEVADLAPLAGLTRLEHLDLRACQHLRNVDAIGQLTRLQTLELGFSNFEDGHVVKPLRRLQTVTAHGLEPHVTRALKDAAPLGCFIAPAVS